MIEMPSGDEMDEDLSQLMEEPPGGWNHGKRTSDLSGFAEQERMTSPSLSRPHVPKVNLNIKDRAAQKDTNSLSQDDLYYHGMRAHRGILQPEEYVDSDELAEKVGMLLGMPIETVRGAFAPGTPDRLRQSIKSSLEDKMLQLSEAGGNMSILAQVLEFNVREDGYCRTMSNLLARARDRRSHG